MSGLDDVVLDVPFDEDFALFVSSGTNGQSGRTLHVLRHGESVSACNKARPHKRLHRVMAQSIVDSGDDVEALAESRDNVCRRCLHNLDVIDLYSD